LQQDGLVMATTITDAEGMYRLPRIHGGEYELHASSLQDGVGFQYIHVTGIASQREDLQLQEMRIMGEMRYEPEVIIEPIVPIEPQEILEILAPTEISTVKDPLASVEKTQPIDESIVFSGFSVKMFPNPTTDKVNLRVEKAGTENLEVTLLNIDGKTVYEGVWLRFMDAEKVIDMQGLPAGIYLLRLQAGNAVVNRQLLKI
jgi:Secretion system C-terminal sorting domain